MAGILFDWQSSYCAGMGTLQLSRVQVKTLDTLAHLQLPCSLGAGKPSHNLIYLFFTGLTQNAGNRNV